MSVSPPALPSTPLDRIRVVLVRTSHPGNIGAAARAMQTMGLSRLVLVSPQRFPHADAAAMAVNAGDVLAAAEVHADLPQALQGTAVQYAFTARSRSLSHAPAEVRQGAFDAVRAAADAEVALVFGNETYGLSNEEVLCCNRLVTIPTNPESTSLNLAAAVQVAAYELRMAAALGGHQSPQDAGAGLSATHEEVELFFQHLERSIERSGFLDPAEPRRLMERMRRLFGRAGLEKEEVAILRGMLTAWDGDGKYARRR